MSGFILDWLRRGEIDLATIYSTSEPKGLASHHGLTEELCLFGQPVLGRVSVPRGGAVTLAEATGLDLILPGLGHGLRDLIEAAAYSTERPLPAAARAIDQLSWDILRKLVRDDVWTATLSHESHRPLLYE